jgi:hypothetical protein
MHDIHSHISVAATLVPAVQTATAKGTAVDLKGFGSAELVINTGAIDTGGTFGIALQESNTTTDGDFTAVVAGDLLGTLPGSLAASSAYRQGYVGNKRYVRAVITKASGTSIAAGAMIVRGHPAVAPVA